MTCTHHIRIEKNLINNNTPCFFLDLLQFIYCCRSETELRNQPRNAIDVTILLAQNKQHLIPRIDVYWASAIMLSSLP